MDLSRFALWALLAFPSVARADAFSSMAPFSPAPIASVTRSGVIPALHLPKLIASSTPNVCIIGDSTSTTGAANLVPTDLLWFNLIRRVREDNPTKTITFSNYAIGGTTWGSFLAFAPNNWPSWYVSHSLWWTNYVQAAGCDTLFINWGVNDTYNLNALTGQQVLTNIAGWGTAPVAWQANHVYAQGQVVLDSNGRMQAVGVNGTSGASAPTWATSLNFSTADSTVVWVLPSTAAYVAKIPDIVLITNKTANPAAGTPYNGANYQTGYLAAADFQRSLALSGYSFGITGLPKMGLIDIGRFFNQAVNGFDPAEQYFSQTITTPVTGISSFPYVLPATSGDFDVTFVVPGTGMAAAGTVLSFLVGAADGTTSSTAVNLVNINDVSGTNVAVNYYPGSGVSPIATNSFSAFAPTGSNTIQLSKQAGHLSVWVNFVLIFDQNVPMYDNGFTPQLSVVNPPGGFAVTLNTYNSATNRRYTPVISPSDCYGVIGGTINGNGINHDASACINLVDRRVLDATRFAQ